MSDKIVFAGDLHAIRTTPSRGTVQIVIELAEADFQPFVALFGSPGGPGGQKRVAITRLNPTIPEVAIVPVPEGQRRTMTPAMQAALRCREPEFWRFLTFLTGSGCEDEERAAHLVREFCGVGSRGDLNHDDVAAARWVALNDQFYGWQRDVRAQT